MSKLDKDQVIAEFTAAYKAAFGKEPQLEQKPGWFSVDGGKNIRLAELSELAQSYGATKAPTKPAKAAAKPAAKSAEKPTAKPAAKKKVAATIVGKSRPLAQQAAAASWAKHIGDGQRMPRGAR
ncbi:hypothetical protein [Alkalimonas amylolytica]|uniref:Uncharacterized protein n=1 Tax=Alkalimonas amylolytica TaxID=152573 RepID=A0A1H4B193_ALKAM|nr:hypothetical protein [Alkalimonas amylolytica]SEA41913.1 hypothetical protein SAMN04488051_103130 [Alkalimonas amylolytica]